MIYHVLSFDSVAEADDRITQLEEQGCRLLGPVQAYQMYDQTLFLATMSHDVNSLSDPDSVEEYGYIQAESTVQLVSLLNAAAADGWSLVGHILDINDGWYAATTRRINERHSEEPIK